MDILFLVMAAVISGAEGWEAIETFGQEKLSWLLYPKMSQKGVVWQDYESFWDRCFMSWLDNGEARF